MDRIDSQKYAKIAIFYKSFFISQLFKGSYCYELEKMRSLVNEKIGYTWNQVKNRKKALLSIGGKQIKADEYLWLSIKKEIDLFLLKMKINTNILIYLKIRINRVLLAE